MSATDHVSYRDIKATVLERVRANTWPPGSLLPGEVDLAVEFNCARTTVNRALRELAEEGILDRKRKAGTRVKEAPERRAQMPIPLIRKEIEATGATYRYTLTSQETRVVPDWLRSRLDLPASAQVLHLKCVHYAGNAPFQFEDRWINIAAVPSVVDADFRTQGPNEWLVAQVPFSDVEITFSASRADQIVADFLNIASGDPVFVSERMTWLRNVPLTYAKMHFGSQYKLVMRA